MEYIISGTVILMGLVIGSFLNVCIYRLPRGESIVTEPSHCPRCGTRLRPLDLFPVFSYLLLGGKCRYCQERISPRYAVVELLTGLVFLTVYLRFGLTPLFVKYAGLFTLLIVVSGIDLEHQLIPNRLVIIAGGWGIFWQLFRPEQTLLAALGGALIGGGLLLVLAVVSRGGMGGGDIKLMTALGFILGTALTALALFIGFLSGSVVGVGLLLTGRVKRKEAVPFGPFLVLGTLVVVLYGREILSWYLSLGH